MIFIALILRFFRSYIIVHIAVILSVKKPNPGNNFKALNT